MKHEGATTAAAAAAEQYGNDDEVKKRRSSETTMMITTTTTALDPAMIASKITRMWWNGVHSDSIYSGMVMASHLISDHGGRRAIRLVRIEFHSVSARFSFSFFSFFNWFP